MDIHGQVLRPDAEIDAAERADAAWMHDGVQNMRDINELSANTHLPWLTRNGTAVFCLRQNQSEARGRPQGKRGAGSAHQIALFSSAFAQPTAITGARR
jgi:hypothetical protein